MSADEAKASRDPRALIREARETVTKWRNGGSNSPLLTTIEGLARALDAALSEREALRNALEDADAWFDAAATRGARTPMKAHELRQRIKGALATARRGEG